MRQFSNLSKFFYDSHYRLTRDAIENHLAMLEGLEMTQDFCTEEIPAITVPAWKAQTMIPAKPYDFGSDEDINCQGYIDETMEQVSRRHERSAYEMALFFHGAFIPDAPMPKMEDFGLCEDSAPFSFDGEFGKVDLGYYEEVYGA